MNTKVFREEGNTAGHVVRMTLRIPIGATGAPGTALQSWGFGQNGTGVPLARTGVGVYTVNLADRFPANTLVGYAARTINATLVAGDGTQGEITAENYSSAAAPTLTLTMYASNTGVAAEIPSGATLLLELVFKNTAQAF